MNCYNDWAEDFMDRAIDQCKWSDCRANNPRTKKCVD